MKNIKMFESFDSEEQLNEMAASPMKNVYLVTLTVDNDTYTLPLYRAINDEIWNKAWDQSSNEIKTHALERSGMSKKKEDGSGKTKHDSILHAVLSEIKKTDNITGKIKAYKIAGPVDRSLADSITKNLKKALNDKSFVGIAGLY